MDKHQFVYGAHRSTQDALLCLTVTSFIDEKASNYARCLFLDISAAFNITLHHIIVSISYLKHICSRPHYITNSS